MADNVQFIGPRESGGQGGVWSGGGQTAGGQGSGPDLNKAGLDPAKGDFVEPGDDDIPF